MSFFAVQLKSSNTNTMPTGEGVTFDALGISPEYINEAEASMTLSATKLRGSRVRVKFSVQFAPILFDDYADYVLLLGLLNARRLWFKCTNHPETLSQTFVPVVCIETSITHNFEQGTKDVTATLEMREVL